MHWHSIGTPLTWVGFFALVLVALTLDLGVFNRKPKALSIRETVVWSAIWVLLAAAFAVFVYLRSGPDRALEFTSGYLIEKALAIDNLFVIALVFRFFSVPAAFQHRVLFWGISGAIVLRGVFIAAGTVLLSAFHWLLYGFGALLVVAAARLILGKSEPKPPSELRIVKWFRRLVPMTADFHGHRFWVRQGGRLQATPLLLALLVVELSDLMFALDSIPAVFAITLDPFIVLTSNVLAILGLRVMYSLFARVAERFRFLKYGLSAILAFVGLKLLLSDAFELPVWVSLLVIAGCVIASVVASLLTPPERRTSKPTQDSLEKRVSAS